MYETVPCYLIQLLKQEAAVRSYLIYILFFVVNLFIFCQPGSCLSESGVNLPEFMNRLVFHSKEFITPIQLCLPKQDSRDVLSEIRNTDAGIKLFDNSGYRNIDNHVLSYLLRHDLGMIESATTQGRYGGTTYYFLFYTDKFNQLPKIQTDYNVCIDVARRIVKSIDYKNRYTGSPGGVETQFYAITFSYFLEGSLPELPKIQKAYKGKAKAYLDPDDGVWKLTNFELEDRAEKEFISLINVRYPPYDPNGPYWYSRFKFKGQMEDPKAIPKAYCEPNKILFSTINSKFIENNKSGRLFIVTGEIRNGKDFAQKLIRLEGKLLTKGQVIDKTESTYAGVNLNSRQLTEIAIADIKKYTNSPTGIVDSVKTLPGMTAPFIIVFSDLPEIIEDIIIEVVSSRQANF